MYSVFLRTTALAILSGGLLTPAAALAAPTADFDTGTIVGTVTCGPDEDAPAAHIVVDIVGTTVQALTDGAGRFTLVGVPAQQNVTVDAVADPQRSMEASRFNVSVQAGETLDIGSMDLGICGQPQQPAPAQDQQPGDYGRDVP